MSKEFSNAAVIPWGRKLTITLISVILILLLPIFALYATFGFGTRSLVKLAARVCKPKLGKILTLGGNIFTSEDFYRAPKSSILTQHTFEGNLDQAECIALFKQNVLNAKFPNGSLMYPELYQFLTKWAGYYFWQNDPTFNLANHFRFIDKSSVSDEELLEVWNELLNQGFTIHKPLWEIIVVRNFYPKGFKSQGPHTAFIIKLHHSLGDGYSWLNLIRSQLFFSPKSSELPRVYQKKKENCFKTFMENMFLPFQVAYSVAKYFSAPLILSPFLVSDDKKTAKDIYDMTDRMSLRTLKEIKNHFGVNMSSVIFTVTALALRDTLIKKIGEKKLPRIQTLLTAYPSQEHGLKLRNQLSGLVINLPMQLSSSGEILRHCNTEYESSRTAAPYNEDVGNILHSSPSFIHKPLCKNRGFPIILSNFPFGNSPYYFNDKMEHKCVETPFNIGLGYGACGVGIRMASYEDGFRITTAVNDAVMSKEEAKRFTQSLQKHVFDLYAQTV